jgi:transposase-like protein
MGKYIHNPAMKFDSEEEERIFLKVMKENMDDYSVAGATGAVQKLLGDIINGVLGEEMREHLGYDKHVRVEKPDGNARNGYYNKTLLTKMGETPLKVPRDRKGEFSPTIVEKGQKKLSEDIECKIIMMYARGTSTREISEQIREIYGFDVSATFISNVTNKVKEEVEKFKERKLEAVYPIVYMDAIRYKVRCDGKTLDKAVNIVLGITMEGKKEILGFWLCENESASYWLNVLNELKNRGVEQILIASVDGLTGFVQAIKSAFPKTEVQRCVVHQVRFSLKLVNYKERKTVAGDLKAIYKAPSREVAEQYLEEFAQKWDSKYPYISKSWRRNWEELATFFKYPDEIRRLIYTTNPIESLNSQLRRVTKTKGVFPSDGALEKLLFLKMSKITEKWGRMPIKNWQSILSQLMIYFEDSVQDWHKVLA